MGTGSLPKSSPCSAWMHGLGDPVVLRGRHRTAPIRDGFSWPLARHSRHTQMARQDSTCTRSVYGSLEAVVRTPPARIPPAPQTAPSEDGSACVQSRRPSCALLCGGAIAHLGQQRFATNASTLRVPDTLSADVLRPVSTTSLHAGASQCARSDSPVKTSE